MKRTGLWSVALAAFLAGMATAENPETLEQAKAQSARQGKPLLIEFFSEG